MELKQRIIEMKDEIESHRATRTRDLVRKRSQNTRRWVPGTGGGGRGYQGRGGGVGTRDGGGAWVPGMGWEWVPGTGGVGTRAGSSLMCVECLAMRMTESYS